MAVTKALKGANRKSTAGKPPKAPARERAAASTNAGRKGATPRKAAERTPQQDSGKRRIAIVGGGMAGLTAAYELSRPTFDDHAKRYREHTENRAITVYQLGWRLGGKGASGRRRIGARYDASKPYPIEEHGLHVWMGFYENAFRLVRRCYAELADRAADAKRSPEERMYPEGHQVIMPNIGDWTDVFFADNTVGVASQGDDCGWGAWIGTFKPRGGLPGDPLIDEDNPYTLSSYIGRALDLLRTLMRSVFKDPGGRASSDERSGVDAALDRLEFDRLSPRLIVDAVTRMLRVGALTTSAGLLQAVLILETILKDRNSLPGQDYKVLEFLDAVASNLRRQLEDVVKIDPRLRRKTELIDLVMTTVVGILRDDLLAKPSGLDSIDDVDARKWLEKHGATWSSLQSPILQGLYDMAFAGVTIDGREQGLAAGQALRCALRMFYTYRGALFWRMRGSMADTVFAPLYRLLEARGVGFEFFHRLREIEVERADPNNPYVSRLTFDVQAKLEGDGYDPLIRVPIRRKGAGAELEAWPAAPKFELLAVGTDRKRDFESHWDDGLVTKREITLRNGKFDYVVLGVGAGAIAHLGGNFKDGKDGTKWLRMIDSIKTVATQAFQVWIRKDMGALGWTDGPMTLTAFEKPFDTWSDMSHVIAAENWPNAATSGSPPSALAYFCGALSDEEIAEALTPTEIKDWKDGAANPGVLAKIRRRVRTNAVRFLREQIGHLWPGPGSVADTKDCRSRAARDRVTPAVESSSLVDPAHPEKTFASLEEAMESQFYTANVNPSDRYVVTVPGSTVHRISPLDQTWVNLVVAGDWTECGFHGGCIEAAVMSGCLASHALTGRPALHEIVGYDHP